MNLEDEYRLRYSIALGRVATAIEEQLRDYLSHEPRIDRVAARPKSIERFVAKANAQKDGVSKYIDPLRQIQDQVGARIITFYLSDVERISSIITRYYRPIEARQLTPDSEWEFGYVGKHFVLLIPNDVVADDIDNNLVPRFFELQIKTLFQHAWSEANHDLGYKPDGVPLVADEKRRLAFTAAQAWGADRMFNDLFGERSSQA